MDTNSKSIFKWLSTILILFIAWKIWEVLGGIFLALVLASIVDGAADFLKKIKFPRALSVIFIYLIIIAAFYFAFYFLIPPLVDEINQLSNNFPVYWEKFSPQVSQARAFLREYGASESFQKSLIVLGEKLAKITSNIPSFLSAIFGGMMTVFLIFFISFLLALNDKGVEEFLIFFIPLKNQDEFRRFLVISQKKIRGWFKARLLAALIVGILVYICLLAVGIKYRVIIAVISALFEFVPLIGPWVAGIFGVILATFQSLKLGLLVLILYFIIQQIENHIFMPLLMKKVIGISPVLTIVVLLIGAKLGGFLGVLISIPLTAIIVEFVNNYRKSRA